jgi:hypothetical protein
LDPNLSDKRKPQKLIAQLWDINKSCGGINKKNKKKQKSSTATHKQTKAIEQGFPPFYQTDAEKKGEKAAGYGRLEHRKRAPAQGKTHTHTHTRDRGKKGL